MAIQPNSIAKNRDKKINSICDSYEAYFDKVITEETLSETIPEYITIDLADTDEWNLTIENKMKTRFSGWDLTFFGNNGKRVKLVPKKTQGG